MDINNLRTSLFTCSLILILTTLAFSARCYGTQKAVNSTSLRGQTLCSIQKIYDVAGYYEEFDKDPAFEFGDVKIEKSRFVLVLSKKDNDDRCKWIIRTAFPISNSSDKKNQYGESVELEIGFNCAALNVPFKKYTTYFGLLNPKTNLEYANPVKAWSLNLDNMDLKVINTNTIYCQNYIAD